MPGRGSAPYTNVGVSPNYLAATDILVLEKRGDVIVLVPGFGEPWIFHAQLVAVFVSELFAKFLPEVFSVETHVHIAIDVYVEHMRLTVPFAVDDIPGINLSMRQQLLTPLHAAFVVVFIDSGTRFHQIVIQRDQEPSAHEIAVVTWRIEDDVKSARLSRQ